jgi:hypothetical protein
METEKFELLKLLTPYIYSGEAVSIRRYEA